MRTLGGILCALMLTPVLSVCDEQHHHELSEREVGSVRFLTSCKAGASDFNRAVALLHSFQYEEARRAFGAISRQDPACAMAHWGIAMSHYHGLWDNSDLAAGREAQRSALKIVTSNPAATRRERAYIEALGEIYREDGKDLYVHAQAFERAMGALQVAYPEDTEAAIFHALTLDITAPKTDTTYANQRKCGEILEPIFATLPNHPGAAHYLIHCYDNPVLAQQGLKAARVYAKIAPASAHAHHMPSHIFTRVGLWDESVQSNKRSEALAAAAEPTARNEARDQRLHAMDYMEYAFLQSGCVDDAKTVATSIDALPRMSGLSMIGDYALAAIPARYAVELGRWDEASTLVPDKDAVPWAQAITWMAVGVGAARSGNSKRAAEAQQKLEELRDSAAKLNNHYWAKQVEVQVQEVEGWMAQQNGESAKALTLMTGAADLEESMDKHAVTPGQIIPARELLGQLLLEQKHPEPALSAFEAVLKLAPKRFNALYGAATAAEEAGSRAMAQRFYQEFLEVVASDERPEVGTARKKVQMAAKK